MNQDATRFTGSVPEQYDRGLGPLLFADYAADLARRVAAAHPASVLELAAGTGIVTRYLRDALPETCQIMASDLNPPMLEVARSKFRPDEAVRFEVADAGDLAFGDGSYDVVTCQFGVMFFPDKARSYREVRRVLTPGGRYLFSVWDSWAENPFARITHDAVATFFPKDPPGFYRVPFSYADPDAIRGSLLDSGFRSVRIEPVATAVRLPSPRAFAVGLVYGNPLQLEIVERGGDPAEVCDAVEQAIARELGAEMPLRALVVEAS